MAGTFDPKRIIDTDLLGELASGGTYTREELAAVPERYLANPYLIIVKDDSGTERYLKFQFDHNDEGKPTGISHDVMALNVLLRTDSDPLGAASWWIGKNALTPDGFSRPADLIGFWNIWEFIDFARHTLLDTDD